MRHPDLPDNPPLELAESAAPQHRSQGWFEVDAPPTPKSDARGDKPAGAVSVRMSHPGVENEITVAEESAPFHTAAGWSVVQGKAETKQSDDTESGSEKTKSERPRASAAKKKEQD